MPLQKLAILFGTVELYRGEKGRLEGGRLRKLDRPGELNRPSKPSPHQLTPTTPKNQRTESQNRRSKFGLDPCLSERR